MAERITEELSRRERQAMDVIFQLGSATAQDVMERIPDRPNYSAIRSLLTVLEEKGWVKHRRESRKFVYEPTLSPERARRGALRRLMRTFFDDSPERLVASLLDPVEGRLSAEERERVLALLEAHNEEARS